MAIGSPRCAVLRRVLCQIGTCSDWLSTSMLNSLAEYRVQFATLEFEDAFASGRGRGWGTYNKLMPRGCATSLTGVGHSCGRLRCQRKLSGTYGGWGVSRVKPRATLLRVLLAVALATATCVREGYSQSQCGRDCPNNPIQRPGPPLQVPGAPTDSGNNKNLLLFLVGGPCILIGFVALAC